MKRENAIKGAGKMEGGGRKTTERIRGELTKLCPSESGVRDWLYEVPRPPY